MKRDAPVKRLYRLIEEVAQSHSVLIGIYVFCVAFIIVALISLFCKDYSNSGFWENLRVEAHGMLFDILVIGVIILFLNRLAEKQIENRRYLDEIDDFRGWKSEEAAHRIAGNIKRLNRNRYKGKINLVLCHLPTVDLYGENLRGANLTNATLTNTDLTHTNLDGAILRGANLEKTKLSVTDLAETDLRAVKKLTLDQLSEVKSLYKAKLDLELMEHVKEQYPYLLEEPKE